MSGQFIVRSSYADIYVDPQTGAIQSIDYAAMGGSDEWDDVEMFDPTTLTNPNGEADCLDTRFKLKSGEWIESEGASQ